MAIINATDGRGILGNASKIELSYQSSIVQVKSQSGLRRAQRRGPLLYNLKVVIEPAMINSERYYDIMKEILALNYGANTLRFKLDRESQSGRAITSLRGSWNAGASGIKASASQIGQSVSVTGAVANTSGFAKAFDYVQFQGSTKVYQVAPTISGSNTGTTISDSYDANGSGVVSIKLNTPLVKSPNTTDLVLSGTGVFFHMAMMEKPKITYLPGDIVEFGDFEFEEVIEEV